MTVKQRVTVASVAFDDAAVADFFDQQIDLGRKPQQFLRIWLHTHPGDSASPSSTDEETFARVFGNSDWAVMFILARGGQTYARLRFNVGPGGHVQIPVEVDFHRPFTKKGDKTPGVQRQCCGSGKVDNCVVTVHLGYAAGDFHTPAGRRTVPAGGVVRRPAAVPGGGHSRRRGLSPQVADRPGTARAGGGQRRALRVADVSTRATARCRPFLSGLDDRGPAYVVEVPSIFHGWLRSRQVLQKQHHRPQDRRGPAAYAAAEGQEPADRRGAEHAASTAEAFRGQAWEKFHVKDTHKGPMVWEAKRLPI